MINREEIKKTVEESLREQGLWNFVQLYDKEHNRLRGTHKLIWDGIIDKPTVNDWLVLSNFPMIDIRKYGAVGDGVTDDTAAILEALDIAQDEGLPLYIPPADVEWLISSYIKITTDNTRIICSWKNGTIRQSTWGQPIFYIRADNVAIYDPYMISTESRSTIAGDLSLEDEGALAAFNFSAGIFISAYQEDKGSYFNVNRWYAEGFTVGIFARGSATQDLLDCNFGDGYCDTVDWGVVATTFQNLTIPSLHGVDIIRGGAGANPEHVLYITGGSTGNCSTGLNIGQLSARNVGNDSSAFQIKYTENVVIGVANAIDCEYLFSFVGEVTGSIGPSSISLPSTVSGTNPVIYAATDCKLIMNQPRIEGAFAAQGIAVDDAILIVHNPHIINTKGTALANNIFYATGGGTLEIFNPKVEYTTTPTDYMIDTSSDANTIIRLYNPQVSGIGSTCLFFQLTAGADAANSYLSFDPKLLSNQPAEESIRINTDTGPYRVTFLGETQTAIALNTNDSVPVANRATYYTITNAAPRNITDFARCPPGHRFTIEATDGNTTFVHAANQLELSGGINYNLPSGKAIEFVERGGCFYETWRSP